MFKLVGDFVDVCVGVDVFEVVGVWFVCSYCIGKFDVVFVLFDEFIEVDFIGFVFVEDVYGYVDVYVIDCVVVEWVKEFWEFFVV